MPGARRILLVDDDPLLRASLAEQLRQDGAFEIVEASDPAQVAAFGPLDAFAAAIIAGEGAARALRRAGLGCPILLLGGSATADLSGAVAHLDRPFRLASLMAELHLLLGRHGAGAEPAAIGPYLFAPAAKTLMQGTRKIRLTEKETDILKFLLAAGGTVARDTLLHEVWGYNPAVTTHTLETHIYRLRRKLEDGILVTEEGGYRLVV